MFKKIRNQFQLKMFLSLACMLIICCMVIYITIAICLPATYKGMLSDEMHSKYNELLKDVKGAKVKEWKQIVGDFCMKNEATITLCYDDEVYTYTKDGKEDMVSLVDYYEENSSIDEGSTATIITTISNDEDSVTGNSDSVENRKEDTSSGSTDTVEDIGGNNTVWKESGSEINVSSEIYSKGLNNYILLNAVLSTVQVSQTKDLLWNLLPFILLFIILISIVGSFFYSKFYIKLRETNIRLKEDMERTKKEEKKRQEFFAAVSHELKTPITIVKGQLEGMIFKVGAYKNRDKYLQEALKETELMQSLIQEILSIARMEKEAFQVNFISIDLKEDVNQIVKEIYPLAENRKIEMQVYLEDNILIHADRSLMFRVFNNIIGNGIIHSPEGEKVMIHLTGEKQKAVLVVENTGAHIEEDDLPKIFEPFYRGDQSRNRETGGSGLGLYVVKTILELHDARYKIENTKNGVRFQMEFALS